MKVCKKCQKEYKDEYIYCPKCGKPYDENAKNPNNYFKLYIKLLNGKC